MQNLSPDWEAYVPQFDVLQRNIPSHEMFPDWLERWNQLNIAIWDNYEQLKRFAYIDKRDLAAEQQYQAYVEQLYSSYLERTNTLIRIALDVCPEPPSPAYQQLWRRWTNQTNLFDPSSVPIQAEIGQMEGRYREIMRNYRDEPGYWMSRRDELNTLMLRLLEKRRALARTSGLPTFLEFRVRELNRLDFSIDDCRAFHKMVETHVVPVVASFRERNPNQTRVPSPPTGVDMKDGLQKLLSHLDPSFAELFNAMRADHLDVGYRAHKTEAIEAWFFPRTGMPYLHVAGDNVGSILHEFGHALHFYLSFQLHRSMWNYASPEEFQEFAAIAFEMMAWPHYDADHGGFFNAEDSRALRHNALNFYRESLTIYVLHDAFEHWVYGDAPDDVTAHDFDEKWLELKQRFTPWDSASDDEGRTGWQRWTWSLFRMPLYMISYPIAVVGACAYAQAGNPIERYTTALKLGNTEPLPALFATSGVSFPFTSEMIVQTAQFITQS